MAVADNTYSRFVQIAKIALPLLALALLSTLFLFSRSVNPEDAIPFVEGDVESIAEDQRVAAPRLSGMTTDGDQVTITAEFATPDPTNPRNITIQSAQAKITQQSGTQIDVSARQAHYEGANESLTLTGDVIIKTSTGYRLQTDELQTSLVETQLISPGPVMGEGPSGQLTAGRMELRPKGASQVLVFKQGVKLVYQP